MITGNEKAWVATAIGAATTVVSYVLSQLPADDPNLAIVRTVLLCFGAVLGVLGGGGGVWLMTNTPKVPADAAAPAWHYGSLEPGTPAPAPLPPFHYGPAAVTVPASGDPLPQEPQVRPLT